jgi:flagellar hook-associated protein 3 FlgL
MSNQQTTVKSLKSNNEDKELSEVVIDYTSAYTAYQASLQAAGKLAKQTLLDYL